MVKRKRSSPTTPRPLLLTCIIAGIAALVLRMANNRLKIAELGEIAGWAGTAFVICLLLIIGIFVLRYMHKK